MRKIPMLLLGEIQSVDMECMIDDGGLKNMDVLVMRASQ